MSKWRNLGILQKKIFSLLHTEEEFSPFKTDPEDFTRKSPLSFAVVASSILHMFKESVEFNMQKVLKSLGAKPVTGSAFTQARYKIKPKLFETLCDKVADTYEASGKILWKGYRLLAGDGSTLNLPSSKDIEAYFGVYSITQKGVKRYLARIFFFYDVMNNFVVRGNLSKMKHGEKTLMLQCLETMPSDKSIIILDRGFGHFCTLKELMGQQRVICVRLSCINSNFAKKALEREEEDFITDWVPSKKERENSRNNGLDCAPIKVRVVKIRLNTGETELLVTNLYDQQEISTEDLDELYHLRWGVEESFKNLKPKMKIEQFGCKKTEGVFQEFYAHIFCMNMVALTGSIANRQIIARTKHRNTEYKYNWKNAYRFLREKIINFLMLKEIGQWLDSLIEEISTSIVAIKPGRSFARDMKACNKKGRITHYNK